MKRTIGFRRSLPLLAIIWTVLWPSVPTARAEQFNFVGIAGGSSVNATADISGIAGSSSLTLSLTNNITNIVTVAQAISGFSFKVYDGAGNPINIDPMTISSQSGRLININGSGTASDVGANGAAADVLSWGITGNPDYITALGFAGGGQPPDETILGLPTSGMNYGSANGSITNSLGHPPFVMHTATFNLQIGQNLPNNFQFRDMKMYFGTTGNEFIPVDGGCVLNCTPQVHTPEPGTLLLLGSGLAGVVIWKKKSRK